MNFQCKFCNRICRPCYEPTYSHTPGKIFWRCDYHGPVVVKYFGDPSNGYDSITLNVILKDINYDCIFLFMKDGFLDSKFRIDKINQPPRTIENVVMLDFHPDITPENISSKLPTYLLFS